MMNSLQIVVTNAGNDHDFAVYESCLVEDLVVINFRAKLMDVLFIEYKVAT